jgi:hypothetical protein
VIYPLLATLNAEQEIFMMNFHPNFLFFTFKDFSVLINLLNPTDYKILVFEKLINFNLK